MTAECKVEPTYGHVRELEQILYGFSLNVERINSVVSKYSILNSFSVFTYLKTPFYISVTMAIIGGYFGLVNIL